METETMGRVVTTVLFENLTDLFDIRRGLMAPGEARSALIEDALVDTGAFLLSMPTNLIQKLGLMQTGTRPIRSSIGVAEARTFAMVRMTIMDRSCATDVLEVPDGTPVLIGQLPLEHLDFVVDVRNRSLIGNPAHGGEHIYELY